MDILLVDDDTDICDDVRSWSKSLNDVGEVICVHSKQDAVARLPYLMRQATQPLLVLVDICLNGDTECGFDILQTLRKDRSIPNTIPVIIYSSSQSSRDITRSYSLQASSFVWKGNGYDQEKRFRSMIEYWTTIAILANSRGFEGDAA